MLSFKQFISEAGFFGFVGRKKNKELTPEEQERKRKAAELLMHVRDSTGPFEKADEMSAHDFVFKRAQDPEAYDRAIEKADQIAHDLFGAKPPDRKKIWGGRTKKYE